MALRNGDHGDHVDTHATSLYIELLKSCLLDSVYGDQKNIDHEGRPTRAATQAEIEEGRYWPNRAHTMVGKKRLDNVQWCVEQCLVENVEGDLLEAGVWRGGSTILMRGVLKAHNVTNRRVFVADSFSGLPPPQPDRYPTDAGDKHHEVSCLSVSKEQVAKNFSAYNLLDDQVVFVPGFFETTLPNLQCEKLAVLRADGDMYSSTIQILDALYDKVSDGGFIIIDDYALRGARTAVDDFRRRHNITQPLIRIDYTGVYWKK